MRLIKFLRKENGKAWASWNDSQNSIAELGPPRSGNLLKINTCTKHQRETQPFCDGSRFKLDCTIVMNGTVPLPQFICWSPNPSTLESDCIQREGLQRDNQGSMNLWVFFPGAETLTHWHTEEPVPSDLFYSAASWSVLGSWSWPKHPISEGEWPV